MANSAIRGVIFGINNVIVRDGKFRPGVLDEVARLVGYLLSNGVQPVVLANRDMRLIHNNETRRLQDIFDERVGRFPWFIAARDGTPWKPRAAAVQHVLDTMRWQANETLYVGSTEDDMRTAVNGNTLFLNATWYGERTGYGVEFASPKDIARFIDIFCRREPAWHYAINDEGLELYTLAPFSTRYRQYEIYSQDARAAAKWGGGHPDFWTKYLWSTLYFSGLHDRVDYITCYPGHAGGSDNPIMSEPLEAFAKCFRMRYLPDLILRHSTATKSAMTRAAGGAVDHLNQLNTIMLNRTPLKGRGQEPYKSPPLRRGKTVLVVDDICTSGNSLEAARVFIEQTGATPILLAWLKTINRSYERIVEIARFDPYEVQQFAAEPPLRFYEYEEYIQNPAAPDELGIRLEAYLTWDWR